MPQSRTLVVRLAPRARRVAPLVAGLAAIAVASRCTTKECTEIGCSDAFSIVAATADKSWAAGEYALALSVDGNEVSCAYTWPTTPPANGGALSVQCSPAVTLSVEPETECKETTHGDAVSQSCTPIPGQFTQRLTIQGTPARVDVVLRRDGAVLGERSFTPQYQTWYPNGEDCGPACRGDTQDWAIP